MPTGRRATDGREPRQVRKEAAISDAVCVAVDPGHCVGQQPRLTRQGVHNQLFFQRFSLPCIIFSGFDLPLNAGRRHLDITTSRLMFLSIFSVGVF